MGWLILGLVLGGATIAGIVGWVFYRFIVGVEHDVEHPGDNT